MQRSTNFALLLATLLFAAVIVPSSGWAHETLPCPTEPAQDVPVASGETYWGPDCVLNSIADVDSFQFKASAGETWTVVLGLGPTVNTQITLTLLAPNSSGGTHIFQGSTCTYCISPGPPTYSVSTTLKLTVSGTYTVVVTETGDAVQTYGLSPEQISPAAPDRIPVTLQHSVNGQVSPPTAQDAFTLVASESGTYEIVLQLAPNPTQQVCLSTYAPNGTAVFSACTCTYCISPGPPTYSVTQYLRPAASGPYLFLVTEGGNDGTVGYDIEASCYSGTCVKIPPTCLLTDEPTYDSSTDTVTMKFYLETPVAATWNGWFTSEDKMGQLWSKSQPITNSPTEVILAKKVATFGEAGILSTLTTPTGGITCSSWQTVRTGKP
jgi:hypothetical protein